MVQKSTQIINLLLTTSIILITPAKSSILSNMSPSDVKSLISSNFLESNCKRLTCEGNSICISKMVFGDYKKSGEFCHCEPGRTGEVCEYHITELKMWAKFEKSMACQLAAKTGIVGIGEVFTYGTMFLGCVFFGIIFGWSIFSDRKVIRVIKKKDKNRNAHNSEKGVNFGSGIIIDALNSNVVSAKQSAAPSAKTSPITKRKMTAGSVILGPSSGFINITEDRKLSTDIISVRSGKSTPVRSHSRRQSPVNVMEVSPLVPKAQLKPGSTL